MDTTMTAAEIHDKFIDEWVLVEDPQINERSEVLGGKVTCHSKDREEVYRHAVKARPVRSAIFFTGEMPPDTAIVL
jgi:hypothetical protein